MEGSVKGVVNQNFKFGSCLNESYLLLSLFVNMWWYKECLLFIFNIKEVLWVGCQCVILLNE